MYITSTLPVVFITFILASIKFYKIVVRLHHWTQTISFYISYFIYASQNHRVWKCFQRSFSPTSCSGQGHQDQVAQGCIHNSIETFEGWKYHHLSGKPLPVHGYPHTENIFFLNLIRISHVHCLFSYHWAFLGRAWLCFLYTVLLGSWRQQYILP